MSDCCTPRGYSRLFSERRAAAAAKRYRRKGLEATERRIVDLLVERGAEGSTVLEVGGGVGAVQVELLRAGARRAVSVELTPTYEEAARQLLREAGLEDRVERTIIDFVEGGADVAAADVVVMNRVLCCYPDMPRLAGAAADHTRRLLAVSYPKSTWWTRLTLGVGNVGLRVFRREFHLFLHSPDEIGRVAESSGLRPVTRRRGLFWEIAAWERPAAPQE